MEEKKKKLFNYNHYERVCPLQYVRNEPVMYSVMWTMIKRNEDCEKEFKFFPKNKKSFWNRTKKKIPFYNQNFHLTSTNNFVVFETMIQRWKKRNILNAKIWNHFLKIWSSFSVIFFSIILVYILQNYFKYSNEKRRYDVRCVRWCRNVTWCYNYMEQKVSHKKSHHSG